MRRSSPICLERRFVEWDGEWSNNIGSTCTDDWKTKTNWQPPPKSPKSTTAKAHSKLIKLPIGSRRDFSRRRVSRWMLLTPRLLLPPPLLIAWWWDDAPGSRIIMLVRLARVACVGYGGLLLPRLLVKLAILSYGGFVLAGVLLFASWLFRRWLWSLLCVKERLFTKVHGEIVERRVTNLSSIYLLNLLIFRTLLINNACNMLLKSTVPDHSQRFKTTV